MVRRVPQGPAVRGKRRPADHRPRDGAEPHRDVPGPGAPNRSRELLLQPDQGVLLSSVRFGGQVPEGDQGQETPGRPSRRGVQAPGTLQSSQPEAVRRSGTRLRMAGKVMSSPHIIYIYTHIEDIIL